MEGQNMRVTYRVTFGKRDPSTPWVRFLDLHDVVCEGDDVGPDITQCPDHGRECKLYGWVAI
jgi:Fe-S-cluster formation regulator IscX/YfhJ